MKTKLFAMLALSGLLFIACDKDDKDDKRVPVRFGSGITAMETKVSGQTENQWDGNETIGVFMVETGSTTVKDGADNIPYRAASEGTGTTFAPVSTAQTIYYSSAESDKVDFIAYYPHTTAIEAYVISLDVADQQQGLAPDLMTTAANNGGAGYNYKHNAPVEMTFEHRLSKIAIKTTAGAGLTEADLTNLSVTLKGLNTKANYNIYTNALSDLSTPADIFLQKVEEGKLFEAILIPQSFSEASLEFALNNTSRDVYSLTVPYDAFLKNNKYIVNTTISRKEVGISATITGWTENNSNGTAW